uniref:Uncharacterized protein n=1 Tax=Anguilla anguilla TaxID=7936 RepID=A0A0E9UFD1_ANGAN
MMSPDVISTKFSLGGGRGIHQADT